MQCSSESETLCSVYIIVYETDVKWDYSVRAVLNGDTISHDHLWDFTENCTVIDRSEHRTPWDRQNNSTAPIDSNWIAFIVHASCLRGQILDAISRKFSSSLSSNVLGSQQGTGQAGCIHSGLQFGMHIICTIKMSTIRLRQKKNIMIATLGSNSKL